MPNLFQGRINMKKAMKKSLAAVLALAMTAGMLTACGDTTASVSESTSTDSSVSETVTDPADEYWCDEFDVMSLSSKEYGTDYTSLYEAVGKDITIADVTEDPDTGFAYITVDGEQHLLGLDFLSMAMVYNDEPAGEYETTDDVYAAWWRLYITRWNYLMPEVPLYSNEY
jgi:peptide/nickel transport system substrate-binding protein